MEKNEILNKAHWDFVVEKGLSSIHTKTFPEAYKEQALIAMEKYAIERVIEELQDLLSRGCHTEYLPEVIQETISDLKDPRPI